MVGTFSSTLEGPDVQPALTEGSRLPAACDQPFLSLGGGVGTVWGIRGDLARGVPPSGLDAPGGAGSQGVIRALESFEEAGL